MKKNIAVIGCGHWGKNLIRNFAELDVLASVCDPNIELAQTYADLYKVNNCSFNEILNNINIKGIVLAVPAPLHASLAIEAMNAGKHVYVEKPLAMNQKEAEEMISMASKNNVQLMVGHLLQYHPVFIRLLELVELGVLGNLNYIYSNRLSFGKVRSEEDVIWSFAPHDISMILSLTKEEPESVHTESSAILQPNIADNAMIHMSFKSGIMAHISLSWLHPCKEQKLVVTGDSGMAVFDDTKSWEHKLAVYKHSIKINNQIPNLEKGEVEYVEIEHSEPLKRECQHFVDVVNSNKTPLTNGNEGLRVLNVLTAATLSANMKILEQK